MRTIHRLHRNHWFSACGALLLALAVVAAGLVSIAVAPAASAATATTCSTADEGSGRYASTLCWLDFSGYNAAEASSPAGQEMSVALPGGSTLTFTVKASGGAVAGAGFPTYSGAYLGNGSYTGVDGRPALYQTGDRTTTDIVLSDIRLTTPSGEPSNAFSLVGADAESTDARESITWRSSNPIYSLTADGADPGIGNACSQAYTGLGTREVVCSSNSVSNKTGTPIVASQAPDTFSQRMVGGGRQAVAFGVLLSQVELNKQVDSRFGGDAFEIAIDDEDGARLYDAATGATGTSATTEEQTIIGTDRGATFTFSETATSGSLDRYDISWACTRNGEADSTLPNGRGAGASAGVHVGIGDFVSCTITNSTKPTSLQLQKIAGDPEDVNGNGIADAGDRIGYTFEVTNTGQLPLTDVTVDDPKVGAVTCSAGELAPGASVTCSADAPYTATADDQADGAVVNTATAAGDIVGTEDSVTSNESSTRTPLTTPAPGIELVKVATPHSEADYVVGQPITYHFVVTNTGNVPLDPVAVEETSFSGSGDLSSIECPDTRLAADRSMTCTATYTLTQEDIDAGRVTNSALATGTPVGGGDPVTSDSDEEIPGVEEPVLGLEKSATPNSARDAGTVIEYTFHLTNRGNVTLTDPSVAETVFTGSGGAPAITCPQVELAPGASVDCTASYPLTQADVDTGQVDNTARASAVTTNATPVESNDSSAVVTIPRASGLTLAKSSPVESYSEVGQQVTYEFVVTNTGNVSMNDVAVDEVAFSGSGELSDVTCSSTTLAGGQPMTCTATYTVTQADLDAGQLDNVATAAGTPGGATDRTVTPPSEVVIPAEQSAALSLLKSADPTEASIGDEIQYTFRVTNEGNVSVVNPQVEETAFTGSGDLSDTLCPQVVLAPGDSVDCTASYEVTAADGAAGLVDNTAVASAQPPAGLDRPSSNESSARVRVMNPAIALEKTADKDGLTVGDTITYSFRVTNTGNVPLEDVTVSEDAFSGAGELSDVVCPGGAASLAPGASVTCTATYEVTQADVDAGAIDNTATAQGTPPGGEPVVSDPDSVEITQEPTAGLDLVKTADPDRVTRAGQVVTYSFRLTNTGTVTLTDVSVEEQEFNGHGELSAITCPEEAASLAPGASVTCTATYTVVARDLTGEPLTNVATGTGIVPPGTPIESDRSKVDISTADKSDDLPGTGTQVGLFAVLGALALLVLGLVVLLLARRNRH
ncbi:DUF11 domain-containing protein [Aeromicrobium sp. YIM 150415]|uniref:CshA/CshB family fibrillar adhesin-related protein n=1 Tax=Aeromicrobium sp. YIM 150415 TaxID=2803912 RepID=UPI0019664553|nr:CshA/CshB family fibrillar adhesin-related protein [Aeromicrobium sp. YIM 150415]MBM9463648.1 DUF11 domain-containing protein [Aeromicrobium sp. YIM 150415]